MNADNLQSFLPPPDEQDAEINRLRKFESLTRKLIKDLKAVACPQNLRPINEHKALANLTIIHNLIHTFTQKAQ